ncbi:MAG: MlaD family protein [Thermodesulfovibrionales bacterium]|nr:MlaD family protein [Thermodesulfovibrionales bacterium]
MKEELKAGFIVVLSMLILTVSVIAIGGSKFFAKHDVYYVRLYDITGLNAGSAVMLGGMRIGSITEIIPPKKPNEPITLQLGINEGVKLYEGVTASISQVGFVGDFILQLSFTNTKNTVLPVGSVIPSVEQASFAAIMSQMHSATGALQTLTQEVQKVFSKDNLQSISEILRNTNQTIVSADKGLQSTVVAIKEMSKRVDSVLADIQGIVTDNKDSITGIIKTARENLAQLKTLIDTYEKAGKNLDATINTAHKVIVIQNDNLDEVLRQLAKTTDALNDAIIEFKQKPWRVLYKEASKAEEE